MGIGERFTEFGSLQRRRSAESQRGQLVFFQVINQGRGLDVDELQYS